LYLYNNELTGSIPSEFGKFKNLYSLYLNNNQLSGSIPVELSDLTSLSVLYLNNNQLSGEIPSNLLKKSLTVLDLSYNELSGNLPDSINPKSPLQYLILSYNNLGGAIPSTYSNLFNLQQLSLDRNKLKGPVPVFLEDLPDLQVLELDHNFFNFNGIETLAQHHFTKFRYNKKHKIGLSFFPYKLSAHAGGTLSNNTYKWFKDGVLTATIVGDSTYTPTANGTYYAEVTNAIATKLTLRSEKAGLIGLTALKQNNITSAQISDTYNFSVYPNPAKTNTTIVFNAIGSCIIKLTDVSGRILQTKTIIAVKGRNTLQLDVSKYAAGVYFVTMSNEKNEIKTVTLNKE
jgi:hypothetical protein